MSEMMDALGADEMIAETAEALEFNGENESVLVISLAAMTKRCKEQDSLPVFFSFGFRST